MYQYFPVNYIPRFFPDLYFQMIPSQEPEEPEEPTEPTVEQEDITGYPVYLYASIIHNNLYGISRITSIVSVQSRINREIETYPDLTEIIIINSRITTDILQNSYITDIIIGNSKVSDLNGESMVKLDVLIDSPIGREN